ncbi:MAG: nucleotidyltransferase domain-containing protein, partial [Planctomycetota bacterium]|nr:nucleotidyltransferase domain-containing protein [Planctomycetota bacterium]
MVLQTDVAGNPAGHWCPAPWDKASEDPKKIDSQLGPERVTQRTRIPEWTIRWVADQIVQRFSPRRIILFGSYARGRPRPGPRKTAESGVKRMVLFSFRPHPGLPRWSEVSGLRHGSATASLLPPPPARRR